MKILHVTDLHSYKPFYQWVFERAANYDAICITGDLIAGSSQYVMAESVAEQRAFIKQWLAKMTTPTFVCSGNHDLEVEDDLNFDLNQFSSTIDDDDFYNSDDSILEPSSAWLLKCKSNNVFCDGDIHTLNNVTIGVAAYKSESLSRFHQCDVVLHHEPPKNTDTAIQDGTDWGSEALYDTLKSKTLAPQYVLCGHVHKPLKNISRIHNTAIYNPGASFKAQQPKHYVIEL